jgi:hypothetical protein
MSEIISAIDKHTPIKIGENGHQEYTWSNCIREKILQLSFQLTRTSDVTSVECQLNTILNLLSSPNSIVVEAECKELLITLYKMIGQTRDIIDGKGEYNLTYMMIYTWYNFFPHLAKYALLSCVLPETETETEEQPYGSWKDIKYFCNFCRSRGCSIEHPLIVHALNLINEQLKIDEQAYKEKRFADISLLCKWIPRETSGKFGWLYHDLATSYFYHYIETAKAHAYVQNNPLSFRKAVNKAKMDYRKLIAAINFSLDTIQIKQCSGNWSAIDFDKTTSITFAKQKKAFLNINKDGTTRSEIPDRVECAHNFKGHIAKASTGDKEIKGRRLGLNSFTSQALQLLQQQKNDNTQTEIDLLNSQWRDNSSQNKELYNFVPMVDTSGSMTSDGGNPLNAAIALGYRIAEKSTIGKRIMTFSTKPTWVNLEDCNNFVDAVRVIQSANWGMNTNFYDALDMILDSCIQKKLSADSVSCMVLAVLSDMQIDSASSEDIGSLYSVMEKKYASAGIRAVGEPYKPPHILFWNLRSTSGFPCLSTQKNVSMISGFSPALLNTFCEKGMDSFLSCTPWLIFMETLNKARYLRLENKAQEII